MVGGEGCLLFLFSHSVFLLGVRDLSTVQDHGDACPRHDWTRDDLLVCCFYGRPLRHKHHWNSSDYENPNRDRDLFLFHDHGHESLDDGQFCCYHHSNHLHGNEWTDGQDEGVLYPKNHSNHSNHHPPLALELSNRFLSHVLFPCLFHDHDLFPFLE